MWFELKQSQKLAVTHGVPRWNTIWLFSSLQPLTDTHFKASYRLRCEVHLLIGGRLKTKHFRWRCCFWISTTHSEYSVVNKATYSSFRVSELHLPILSVTSSHTNPHERHSVRLWTRRLLLQHTAFWRIELHHRWYRERDVYRSMNLT
jgi:hypothetical protein